KATEETLLKQLEALPHANMDAAQPQILQAVADWREERVAVAQARFEQDGDAARLLEELAASMDEIIAALFKLLMAGQLGVAVVATGGYGRREMFPYSDVDL